MATLDGGMPLYISGPSLTPAASGIQLYLFGTLSQSGVQGGIPLILESTSGNFVNGSLNLFTQVDSFAPVSGNLNLYLNSENAVAYGQLDLFVGNYPSSSGLSLYIKGLGNVGNGDLADGYFPYQSGMNLYIERGVGNGVNLFIRGQDISTSGDLSLFLNATLGVASGLALSIPNTAADIDNSLTLTIQGF